MSKKVLVAFDFDHTIIDDNSDLKVRELAPDGVIPQEIKDLYSVEGWTEYMGAIFRYLHENGTTADDITNCMKEIPFIEGIIPLFELLSNDCFHTIIISDSNSVFINCIMKAAGLDNVVNAVYTNPAKFEENGCLTVEYYHTQDWCDLSTRNMCKGHILEEHISKQLNENKVTYDTVVYVGDGGNDFCPTLKLRQNDVVFPRIGFKLEKMLEEKDTEDIKCKIIPWNSGKEIMEVLKSLPIFQRV